MKKDMSLYLIALGYFFITVFFLYVFSFIAFTWLSMIIIIIGMCTSTIMFLKTLGKTKRYKWIEE